MNIDFIVGCGHSGTTLIANILGAHPEVHCPSYESKMMFSKETPDSVYRKLVAEAEQEGKGRIVEKSPEHILHIPKMREMFPNAKFVSPVRDGRDVAASIKKRTGNLGAGIHRWKRDVGLIWEYSDDSDFMVYRHEDLVDNPREVVERICRFLGLSYSDRLLEYHKKPRSWFGVKDNEYSEGVGPGEHEKRRSWQVNQPIFDSRGRWKNEFGIEDFDLLERKLLNDNIGKILMKQFNYA